jgi:hypothetical protein
MLNKKTGLIALLTGVAASGVWAGTLTNYTVGDVLVCFRNGGVDMVVDAGSVSTLTNATHNQRITITGYNSTQLGDVGVNGASWSAFAWLSDDTLFVTRARTVLHTQTTPWLAARASAQSGTVLRMASIPPGAVDELAALFSPDSTASAVIEDNNSTDNPNYSTPGASSYDDALTGSYGGNFDGTFEGDPENTTLDTFTTGAAVVRSDFYQMTPTSGYALGTWLGYFELSTNGVMSYVAYPSTVPVTKSISRSVNATTINYTTGLYGTYTLRGTNILTSGTAATNWPVIATLSSGDNATHTFTDTTASNARFYVITGQ